MLVVSAQQMKDIEAKSLDYDLTMPRLMENAGSAASAAITEAYNVDGMGCVVFSGRGNNGGDGFVVARRLYEAGAHVLLVLVNGEPKTAQAKQMFDFLSVMEIPVLSIEDSYDLVQGYSMNADLIVDAIYGIGFHGELTGTSLSACNIINSSPARVVSLDTPSGIESDEGSVAKNAVKADTTITFEFLKPLHILPQSAGNCGKVITVSIGIPENAYKDIKSKFNFTTEERVWDTIPTRPKHSHKGTFGKLLAICGSARYRGAATMAVTAAYRTGVGLCTLAAPETVCSAVSSHIPETILQPMVMNSYAGIDFEKSLPLIEQDIKNSTAVLFGCGFGEDPAGMKILRYLITKSRVPVILDADGLNILSKDMDLLYDRKSDIILTPHPGEMARLMDNSIFHVQADRISAVTSLADQYGVYVVLKGSNTLFSTPEKELHINETGGPGLAKGGSGDILAGMIGALLAQKLPITEAVTSAVWLHGKAGERCAERLSETAMLPHEILEDLSQMFKEQNK